MTASRCRHELGLTFPIEGGTLTRDFIAFASQRGKTLVILGERTSSAPYILGNFPRIEIVFALVDKPNHASVASEHDKIGSLERLKKLFDDGTLTQQEFEREKAKILTRDE